MDAKIQKRFNISSSKHLIAFTVTISAILIPNSSAFTPHTIPKKHRDHMSDTAMSYSSIDETTRKITSFHHLNFDDSIYSQAEYVMNYATDYITNNPDVIEGAVFQYLSHFALDLSIFIISPENTTLIRLFNLIGRLFSILSTYIPQNSVRPDELAFQISMLGVTFVLFTRSISPRIKVSLSSKPSLPARRDVIAYRKLFQPVGITWIQFRSLFASGAMDWLEIKTNESSTVIQDKNLELNTWSSNQNKTNGTYVYWVYDRISKSFDVPDNIGELAIIQFVRKLEKRKQQNKSFPLATDPFQTCHQNMKIKVYSSIYNISTVQNEITVLRVNADKMIEVVEDNEDLFLSILFLVVNGLQQKIEDNQIKASNISKNRGTCAISSRDQNLRKDIKENHEME